jgi:hypothetical protein
MGIYGRKSSSSNQGIAVLARDMDVCLRILILLRKAKINDMDGILVRVESNQDIVGLQVSVNNMMCVDLLKARNLCN